MKKARCTVFGPVLLVFVFLFSACQAPGASLAEETKDYVWPVRLITLSGLTAQETKDHIEGLPDKMAEEVIVNEDGSVTIRCTESQRVKWVENTETLTREKAETFGNDSGLTVTISEKMDEIQLRVYPDTTHPQTFLTALRLFIGECYIYQIFSDIPPDDCLIHFSVINEKTGNVVGAETFPGEGKFQLDPEDWK